MKKSLVSFAVIVFLMLLWLFLRQVFLGNLILPQSFAIGSLTIHYYGLILALAVTSAFYLGLGRAVKYQIDKEQAEDLMFWVIIGGLVGARIYHVLSSFNYYWLHPVDILKVWNGGLSIYGAVLGGIISLMILKKLLPIRYSIFAILDWLAPSVVLGQIIGRFGNLFNYEAFGYPTNLPWKMFVPQSFRPEQFVNNNFFHPFFLYEALGNILIVCFLLNLGKSRRPGKVVFLYLLLYNALRCGLEFLRIDSTFIFSLRLNAIVSLALIILSAASLIFYSRHGEKIS